MVEINLTDTFKATVDGKELTIQDMGEIHHYYQACCVAEYLEDNYVVTTVEAIDIGYDTRRLMEKYDITEEEAIYKMTQKYALKERRTA